MTSTMTLADPLLRAARVAGNNDSIVCGAERFTFQEMADRASRAIAALQALGARRGDRIAYLADTCHRFLELYQGVPAGGMVIVPLNTRHTVTELSHVIQDAGARILVTDRDPGPLAEAFDHVLPMPDGYETALRCATTEGPERRITHNGQFLHEDDVAALYYTGGTTGKPKGVMLTHRNLLDNAAHVLISSGLGPDDVWLIMAPPFHVSGPFAVLATVWATATQVIQPAFEPASALELIAEHGVTATLGVPTMLAAMAQKQQEYPRDMSSLRYLVHAGGPIASDTVRRVHEAFPSAELVHMYGATETAPLATVLRREQDYLTGSRATSCGQPVPGVDVEIIDEFGRPCRPGKVGEVSVRGANVMKGYWNKPRETAEVLIDGWYRSGDLGYLDEKAFLYLVDRVKDMIVSGGENVYSTEVEDALSAHPHVAEAAVFGVPDERWGEAVHAVVVPHEAVTVDQLIGFCRERIAGYKVPKSIDLQDDPLPKTGAGKVLKHSLREPYWKDVEARIHG